MLNRDQIRRVLRELIAPQAVRSHTLVIEDRAGLLGPAIAGSIELTIVGQRWLVLSAEAGSILDLRRRLWEQQIARVAIVVPPDAALPGLRDITSGATYTPAGGGLLLRALADLDLPDEAYLDPVAAVLLERPAGLELLRGQEITRARLPTAIMSALLSKDLLQAPSSSAALACILDSELEVPKEAHPLCRDYAAMLSPLYQPLVIGLLTFGRNRSLVAQALLRAHINFREGQVAADPLVIEFLEHAAVNEFALLEAFATRIEEAILAEPEWGRHLVQQLPKRKITHFSRILPIALETDIRDQLAELIEGKRTAVDDRLWREHLFYEEYNPWVSALSRLAVLAQVRAEIEQLLTEQDQDITPLVQAYVGQISFSDLAYMELGELAKKAVPLSAEIKAARAEYQKARTDLNRVFAQGYAVQYPYLFGSGRLVTHLLHRVVKPRLDAGEQVLLIIVDGMNYPLWQRFKSDLIASSWQVEDGHALALLPTITAISRYSLFSGPISTRLYPDLAEPDDDAPTGDELKALIATLPAYSVALCKKRELRGALGTVVSTIEGREHDLVVVVINEIDDAIRSPVHTPFPLQLAGYPFLNAILDAARACRRAVFLTADHGFTPDRDKKWPLPPGAKLVESRLAKGGQPAADSPVVPCENLVYELGGPFLALYDFGGRFSQQPKVGYHSGMGLEEVVVPAAWIKTGSVTPSLDLRFVGVPSQLTEDAEILVTVELRAVTGLPGDVRVEIWLPGMPAQTFHADLQAGLPFQRWQISWRPTLPPREPVEPQVVWLRGICYRDQVDAGHTEVEVMIQPRRGKYESAAAALLP